MILGSVQQFIRLVLQATILRPGAVGTVLRGPARGIRYRIFSDYGLAPLLGRWEPSAQRLMEKHISPGCAAYDIGANHGVHTLLMAKLVGRLGHVYAFEPIPEIMARLRENVQLNGFSNVTCVELALGDWTGSSWFARGIDSSRGRLVGPSSGELSVGITTLDEYVLGEGHRAPCFVKLDVEGAESRVLSGAKGVLKAHRPTLLIELHNPTEDVAVGGILRDLGYVAVRICDGSRVRDLTRGWPDPNGLWGQVIAFRSGSENDSSAHS